MRVLVTGGAGFIGSHFARRLAGQGEEVVVLDKLTYAGNRANLEGVEHEFHQGDIADPEVVARAAEGADAVLPVHPSAGLPCWGYLGGAGRRHIALVALAGLARLAAG